MKDAHVLKKYKVTTNSNHQRPIYDNVLQRQFTVDHPNIFYVSDITYIWAQEGWLYLTVMMDLFSRRIVGWHMSSQRTADTVCMAYGYWPKKSNERPPTVALNMLVKNINHCW